MGLLLSPIWDGSFIRDGKHYSIKPAVWIFASTGLVEKLSDSNKGSDFISRLNGPIIELDTLVTQKGGSLRVPLKEFKLKLIKNPDIEPESDNDYNSIDNMQGPFRTEQAYLGVSLLNNNKKFGPISKIQVDVLQFFHDILLINGFRSMEFLVSKFHNIERGIVYASNVPDIEKLQELKRHVVFPKKEPQINWRKLEERPKDSDKDLIKIETLTNIGVI